MKYLKTFKIFETPDNSDIIPFGNKPLTYFEKGAYAFGFDDNLEAYLSKENDCHAEIKDNIDFKDITLIDKYKNAAIGKEFMKYAGRIWIHDSLISFWDYPETSEILNRLLNGLNLEFEKLYDIKIDTNRFIIEVYIDKYDSHPCLSGADVKKEKKKYRAKAINPSQYYNFLKGELPI